MLKDASSEFNFMLKKVSSELDSNNKPIAIKTYFSNITSGLATQDQSVIVPISFPSQIKEYYTDIIKGYSKSFVFPPKKEIVGISTIIKDLKTQQINFNTLIQTINKYVVMPLNPDETIEVVDDNNKIITSINRGTGDNINKIYLKTAQVTGNWLNMNSSIMINGYQFKLLALGSPPLWDSVGPVIPSRTRTFAPSYYNYITPQYYFGYKHSNILTFGLFIIIILLIFIYYTYSDEEHNNLETPLEK